MYVCLLLFLQHVVVVVVVVAVCVMMLRAAARRARGELQYTYAAARRGATGRRAFHVRCSRHRFDVFAELGRCASPLSVYVGVPTLFAVKGTLSLAQLPCHACCD